MLGGELNGKEILKSGDICIPITYLLSSTAETFTTLQSNYTPIEIKKKKILSTLQTSRTRMWAMVPIN